jgi:Leucine-rich repeat (LRR) protein
MPILNCESANFTSLSISDLTGLGRSANLKQLRIADCQSLSDIEELEQLKSLEELEIINCPSLLDYTVLERLLALKNVEIRSGRMEQVRLPSRWPGSLCELRVVASTNQIGDLPSQFAGRLDLTTVTGLTTLDNLRSCSQIDEIRIRLSAIYKIKDLCH